MRRRTRRRNYKPPKPPRPAELRRLRRLGRNESRLRLPDPEVPSPSSGVLAILERGNFDLNLAAAERERVLADLRVRCTVTRLRSEDALERSTAAGAPIANDGFQPWAGGPLGHPDPRLAEAAMETAQNRMEAEHNTFVRYGRAIMCATHVRMIAFWQGVLEGAPENRRVILEQVSLSHLAEPSWFAWPTPRSSSSSVVAQAELRGAGAGSASNGDGPAEHSSRAVHQ